jgi:hypothetical protein
MDDDNPGINDGLMGQNAIDFIASSNSWTMVSDEGMQISSSYGSANVTSPSNPGIKLTSTMVISYNKSWTVGGWLKIDTDKGGSGDDDTPLIRGGLGRLGLSIYSQGGSNPSQIRQFHFASENVIINQYYNNNTWFHLAMSSEYDSLDNSYHILGYINGILSADFIRYYNYEVETDANNYLTTDAYNYGYGTYGLYTFKSIFQVNNKALDIEQIKELANLTPPIGQSL